MGLQRFLEKWVWEFSLVGAAVVIAWDAYIKDSEDWTCSDWIYVTLVSAIVTKYAMRQPHFNKLTAHLP